MGFCFNDLMEYMKTQWQQRAKFEKCINFLETLFQNLRKGYGWHEHITKNG